ncbi:meiotic recombination protein REC114 isoform X3 [Mixophyes fleayi]|uniref:meiotic recombination protein REC114 isoform X3 n=1 Tax=Mixophyes fleayi TaxID=3061075 RepID=UPI003F4E3B0A
MAAASSGVVGQGEEWVLQRYGRLGTPGEKNETSAQRRVFETNEESGIITLSILNTGQFFISQGHTLLEGFSLISAKSWLKVGKNSDCLLFGTKAKNESSQTFREERIHVAQVAESMLSQRVNDLGTTYQYPALSVVELGSFLKLCLLDKDFPAFVEAVEQELNKLTQK